MFTVPDIPACGSLIRGMACHRYCRIVLVELENWIEAVERETKFSVPASLFLCYRTSRSPTSDETSQIPPQAGAQVDTTLHLAQPPQAGWHSPRLSAKGRPIFVGGMDGGISTRKAVVSFGEPVVVDIWIDNRTDRPAHSGGRCLPFLELVDAFDESGHRLISRHEQAELDAKATGFETVDVCASTGPIVEIPLTHAKRCLSLLRITQSVSQWFDQ